MNMSIQKVHIKSFKASFNDYYQQLGKAVSGKTELTWSFQKTDRKLTINQLMMLLLEDVDFVLLSQSQLPYPHPQQVQVAAVIANKDDAYDPLFLLALNTAKASVFKLAEEGLSKHQGRVDIVGFGPGNPELLTLKAHRLIQEADVIYYDDLLDNTYLNQFAAERIYVGKRKGKHSTKQDDINRLLYASAIKGKKVLRLKGGDPLIFGRGGEEYHYLKRRLIEVEIVPGITSALAAAADAVLPLTSRGTSTSVAFTLGHDAIYNKLPVADTLVFYMGASQQQRWAQRLVDNGWPANTPVAAVRNASLPSKEIVYYTLGQLSGTEVTLPAPALLIVGQTASPDIEKQNQKWLYTGTDVNFFKQQGIVVHNPMVAVNSKEATVEGQAAINNLKAFDRILFASPFAVREFFKALQDKNLDVRAIANHQLTSIGISTSAELKKHGLVIKPETSDNTAGGLLASFKAKGISRESILLPCSDKGLFVLPKGLRELGNQTFQLQLYTSVIPDNAVIHNLDDFTGIVFSSPTAVHHFFQLYAALPATIKVLTRGKYTKELVQYYLEKLKLNKIVLIEEVLV